MFRLLVALILVVAACAPTTQLPTVSAADAAAEAEIQKEIAFEAALEDNARLQSVAGRVLFGATQLCGDRVKPAAGVFISTVYDHPYEFQKAARKVAMLGDVPRVMFTVPGSPADHAGLRTGDEITAFNALDVPSGSTATKTLTKMVRAAGISPYVLTVHRPERKEVRVEPVQACDFTVKLDDSDAINAAADGKKILVTQGMLRFTRNDDELALVVAHELAHNAMGHLDKKRGNVVAGAAVGLVFDVLAAAAGVNTGGTFSDIGGRAGARAFSKGFEAEADYVALYMLERSGFPIERAPIFWRRMATVDPKSIDFARTHPTSPERFVLMTATVKEIGEKKAAGLPLVPSPKTQTTEPVEAEQSDR